MELQDFSPLNTKDAVDKLLMHLQTKHLNYIVSSNIETKIMFNIRKLKLQLYFKEKYLILVNTKNQTTSQPSATKQVIKTNKARLKTKKEPTPTLLLSDAELPKKGKQKIKNGAVKVISKTKFLLTEEMVIHKSIFEVAEIIGQPASRLITFLAKKNLVYESLKPEDTFDYPHWMILARFMQNAFNLKKRKELPIISIGNGLKKKLKFQPSYGKEGNYRNLIYIGTKT